MSIQKYVNDKFERDLEHMKIELKKDRSFGVDVYRALCNMRWRMKWTPFKYSCSWRYAGGLIAKLRDQGENYGENYMDFYCSGNEGKVTEKIRKLFDELGWIPSPWPKNPDTTFNKTIRIIKKWLAH